MDPIEANLYQFYQALGQLPGVNHPVEDTYEAVSSKTGRWPQLVFNLNKQRPAEKLVPQIAHDIDRKKIPPFVLAAESHLGRQQANLLKESRFMPVKIMQGMQLSCKGFSKPNLSQNVQIASIGGEQHLEEFPTLVNQMVLSRNLPVDLALLAELAKLPQMEIVGLFVQEKLASAALVFTQNKTAGLYFIATQKVFQNQGFASLLLKFILHKCGEDGTDQVVLHANNRASRIYEKIGFAPKSNFIVYQKV